MCLGDWKAHGSEYYECSRYKENPNIANESVHAQVSSIIIYILFHQSNLLIIGTRSSQEIFALL